MPALQVVEGEGVLYLRGMSMLERIKRQIITQAEEPVMLYELMSMSLEQLNEVINRAVSDNNLECCFGTFADDLWGSDIYEFCKDRKLYLLEGIGAEDDYGYRDAYIVESLKRGYERQAGILFFPLPNRFFEEIEEYEEEVEDPRIICLKMFKKHKTRIADFDAYRRLNKAAYRRRNRKSNKK